jgi:hypothetical protein
LEKVTAGFSNPWETRLFVVRQRRPAKPAAIGAVRLRYNGGLGVNPKIFREDAGRYAGFFVRTARQEIVQQPKAGEK